MRIQHRTLLLFAALPVFAVLLGLAATQDSKAAGKRTPFAGKTVVVTGANRGLGLEFARQLSAAGATVIGTARKPDAATELTATGARVLQLDVTDVASVAAFSAAVGEMPIDMLINNAGILGRQEPSASGPDLELVERTIDVNLLGPIRVTHALLTNLLASEGARVVNISSILGSIESNRNGGYLGYRESKAGLNMFTRSFAAEHRGEGVLCIAVHPGWVSTDMGGPNAPLTPEQSVRNLLELIGGLEPEQSGGFFQGIDGEELPW